MGPRAGIRWVALLIVLAGGFRPLCLGAQQAGAPKAGAEDRRPISLAQLPRNILRDQKFLWLRPFRLKRADLPWAATLVGSTAGLVASDRPVAQELSDQPPGAGFAFSRRLEQVGGGLTDFGVAGAFYLVGRWRGDARARTTGLLGLEAVADSLIVVEVLKSITQRPRPTRDAGRIRNHNADGEFFAGGRSFPSGHAAQAWALATVVAQQYRHRRWIPPTTYGLAGLVAVSRVTARKHFPSDVLVGSVLGYLIGLHVARTYGPEAQKHERAQSAHRRSLHLGAALPVGGGAALALTWEF